MSVIKIYGRSDDCIYADEIEGKVKGCDEFYADAGNDEGDIIVCFPTGDRFRVSYGDRGVWAVEQDGEPSGLLKVEIEKAPEGEDPDPYTDTATVSGNIERVDFFHSWPPDIEEIRDRIEPVLDNVGDWDDDVLRAVWEVLGRP